MKMMISKNTVIETNKYINLGDIEKQKQYNFLKVKKKGIKKSKQNLKGYHRMKIKFRSDIVTKNIIGYNK